jgi:hypothetical protein
MVESANMKFTSQVSEVRAPQGAHAYLLLMLLPEGRREQS